LLFAFGCENVDLSQVSDEDIDKKPEGQVLVQTSKNEYEKGEIVIFTVTNLFDKKIYYNYGGCSKPFISRKDDAGFFKVVTSITEEIPDTKELAPGESFSCDWDQKAWQNPDNKDRGRFQSYLYNIQVLPGEYRIEFKAYFDAQLEDVPKEFKSESFTFLSPEREIIDYDIDCSEERVGTLKDECIVVDNVDRSCQSDADCVLVEHICGECGYAPVNKITKEKYENLLNELCSDVTTICGVVKPDEIACHENKCVFFNEN